MEHASGLLHALGFDLTIEQLRWFAVAIFVGVYAMIMLEKYFHRTVAAMLGAAIILVLGIMPPAKAWAAIDFNTIFLLFGMMNIVTLLVWSGFFNVLTKWVLRYTGINPVKIMIVFAIVTAVLSAFLDNVTTVLFITPIIIRITEVLELNPIPYVVSIILASNMGGTTTLIGDPPNIIIGSIAGKHFMDFIINVAPFATIAFIVGQTLNVFQVKVEGHLDISDQIDLEELEKLEFGDVKPKLMFKAVTIFLLTILLFFIGHIIHIEPGIIALFMATILMLWSGISPVQILEKVEWATLIFFMGLFIVVGSLEYTGVFEMVASWLLNIMGDDIGKGIWIVGGFSALISGIVDNIPFTMSMALVLKDIAHVIGPASDHLWWALSLGACLGGNFTLIGASANIVAADISTRHGHPITFMTFLRYGTPVAVISTFTALIIYYLVHIIMLKTHIGV